MAAGVFGEGEEAEEGNGRIGECERRNVQKIKVCKRDSLIELQNNVRRRKKKHVVSVIKPREPSTSKGKFMYYKNTASFT